MGYKPGPVDGVLGKGTKNSIRAFQSENYMPDDGNISESLIKKLRRRHEETSYISQIELKNLEVGEGERWGKSVSGIFGTVVNNGDKTLSKAEVAVYFLDHKNAGISEKKYFPVLANRFSGSNGDPLKPNTVKDFGYSVEETAPHAWSRKVKAKITKIEFNDE